MFFEPHVNLLCRHTPLNIDGSSHVPWSNPLIYSLVPLHEDFKIPHESHHLLPRTTVCKELLGFSGSQESTISSGRIICCKVLKGLQEQLRSDQYYPHRVPIRWFWLQGRKRIKMSADTPRRYLLLVSLSIPTKGIYLDAHLTHMSS